MGAALLCATAGLSAQTPEVYGPVQPGQTLWGLAGNLTQRYPAMTRYEIMAAIRTANPDAFIGDSAQLRTGVGLILPPDPAARTLAQRANLPAAQRSSARPAETTSVAQTDTPAVADAATTPATPAATPVTSDNPSQVPASSNTDRDTQPAPATPPQPADTQLTYDDRTAMLRARQQLADGNAEQAYKSLLSRLQRLGGIPEFDYLFGTAALDVGAYGQAVLALQRVVFADPEFAGARIDLARAYLATGDRDNARRELQRVQQAGPPPQIAAAVQQLLDALDSADANATRPWTASAFATAGFDSNANASTRDDNFLGFELDPRNQETDSPFVGTGGSGRLRLWSADQAALTLGGHLGHRHFPDADFVDATLARVDSRLVQQWNKFTISAAGIVHYGLLDGAFNNKGMALESAVGYGSGPFGVQLKLRSGTLRFRDALSAQDVDQAALGLTGLWQASARLGASLTLITGEDEAREASSAFSRDISGVRSALVWQAAPTVTTTASAGWLNADYPDPFFGQAREDDQYTVALGATLTGWLPPQWRFEPSARFIDTDSTVTLFKYDRFEVGFTVARQF